MTFNQPPLIELHVIKTFLCDRKSIYVMSQTRMVSQEELIQVLGLFITLKRQVVTHFIFNRQGLYVMLWFQFFKICKKTIR